MNTVAGTALSVAGRGSPFEVLRIFLRLGLTSFGGPVAHLGYFRAEFVERRRWLDEAAYADIVALCQFLPGPASSQTGISIGIWRAGIPGALCASTSKQFRSCGPTRPLWIWPAIARTANLFRSFG